MKTFWIALAALAVAAAAHAAEKAPEKRKSYDTDFGARKTLRESLFVVESGGDDAVDEGLNRISGDIDLGFAAPDDTYKSESHYRPGPFGRQEAMEQNRLDDY